MRPASASNSYSPFPAIPSSIDHGRQDYPSGSGKAPNTAARRTSISDLHENSIRHLLFIYTVQPGDTDTDGILIPENPLGGNADLVWQSAQNLNPNLLGSHDNIRIPANMLLPENQLSADQVVDGSSAYDCQELHCTEIVVGSPLGSTRTGLDIFEFSSVYPHTPAGRSRKNSFVHAGDVHVVGKLNLNSSGEFSLVIYPRLQDDLYRRIGAIVGDRSLGRARPYFGHNRWVDSGLTWSVGDEVAVQLIETSDASLRRPCVRTG